MLSFRLSGYASQTSGRMLQELHTADMTAANMIRMCVQSPAVLDACCSALQALYEEQQNKLRWDTIKKLRQYGPFSLKYATIKNNLQGKGQRATGKQDSQVG
jgi:hypothetical protein